MEQFTLIKKPYQSLFVCIWTMGGRCVWNLLLFLYLFTSCIGEEKVIIKEEPVQATISIQAPGLSSDPDNLVNELRIMAFKASNGSLAFNELYDFTTNYTNPINLELTEDTYDFIFIGNEKSDPLFHNILDVMDENNTLTQLTGYSFASTAFSDDPTIPIPMSSAYYNIILDKTQGLSEDGGSTFVVADQTNPWRVNIERLGVRVDVKLKTQFPNIGDDFKSLEFSRIPNKVPILAKDKTGNTIYNSTGIASDYETQARSHPVSSGEDGAMKMTYNPTDEVYEWKKKRVILPSSLFATSNDENLGVLMTAKYNTINDQTAVLGPIINLSTSENHGYNLPRNHWIAMNGELDLNINLELKIESWESGFYEEYEPGKPYTLYVSDAIVDLTQISDHKLEITTNHPDGWSLRVSSRIDLYEQVIGNNYLWLKLSHDSGPQGTDYVEIENVTSGYTKTLCYLFITAGNMTTVVAVYPRGVS